MKYKTLLEKDVSIFVFNLNKKYYLNDSWLLLNAVFKSKQDWKQLLKWDDI